MTAGDAIHPAALTIDQLVAQCRLDRTRRGGPGGQHRNKVETAVVATHLPTGVMAEANERRSQAQNRQQALFRLRVNLALEVRSAIAHGAPSELWRSRCRGGKIAVNPEHDDFPAMLAEALDAIAHAEFDVKLAAKSLGCSTTQLVRLLALEPRALGQVNRGRAEVGLLSLHG